MPSFCRGCRRPSASGRESRSGADRTERCCRPATRWCIRITTSAYDLLAEDPTAFYRGDFADALVSAVEHSAALDIHDLRIYRVVESAPRQAAFGGYTRAGPR